MRVELEFRPGYQGRVDASSLQPGLILRKNEDEIRGLPLMIGNQKIPLGELCIVRRNLDVQNDLVLSGETQSLIKVGHSMKGGRLTVEGNTGDEVGVSMSAGIIHVHGNVGDWCGANENPNSSGMQGGMIFVDGSAGDEVGAGMRRGMIFVSVRTRLSTLGARMGAAEDHLVRWQIGRQTRSWDETGQHHCW